MLSFKLHSLTFYDKPIIHYKINGRKKVWCSPAPI